MAKQPIPPNTTKTNTQGQPKKANTPQQPKTKTAVQLDQVAALESIGIQPIQPLPLELPGNPKKEYAAGGTENIWLSSYARALPQYIDDLTLDFGPDLYGRMLRDAQVKSSFNSIKLGVLAQGVTIVPAIDKEDDPDFALAVEVADFCRRQLGRPKKPFGMLSWQMLDAMAQGHKVAELTFEDIVTGVDAGKFGLKDIKVKPQEATAFVVDVYLNLLGLLAMVPGSGAGQVISLSTIAIPVDSHNNGTTGTGTGSSETETDPMFNPDSLPKNFIRRDKWFVFTFDSHDEDPRGRSMLRAAYDPWWCKQQTKNEYIKYLAQFAIPGLHGELAADAQALPKIDSKGDYVLDADGNMIMVEPTTAMAEALAGFRNGGIVVTPNGSTVTPIQVQERGEVFISAFNFFNSEISISITNQTLANSEGDNMSRAAATTHQDEKDKVVAKIKLDYAAAVKNDILKTLVRYNFGDEAAERLIPEVSLSETENQDFAVNLTAVAAAQTSGYLHDSQYPALDAKIGLPARDMEAMQAEKEANQQMQQKALEAKANQPAPAQPGPGPGQPTPAPAPAPSAANEKTSSTSNQKDKKEAA